MKIITCPINGPRPEQEFAYGGRYRPLPDSDALDDAAWAEHLYPSDGAPGIVKEWWYHVPSGTWFIAERNTLTDTFLRTYLYSETDPHDR